MTPSRCVLLILCPLAALGCQAYAPQPLDLRGHRLAVDGREASSPEVVAYARRLAAAAALAPFDPADGLSLDEAEVVALFFNAHLRTARLKAQVPLAGAAEAGRWEDPELRVDAERIIDSVEHPWVLGGVLNLTLPLSGRLRAEKGKALAQAGVEQARVVLEEQKVLAELRAAWLEWSAAREQAELTRSTLKELDEFVATAEKLRAAGELDPLDARLFRIERLTRAGRLQTLEAETVGSEIELKARLGLSSAAAVKLVPSLGLMRRQVPATQQAADLAEHHPRVQVARADYEAAERALRLEIRKQYPDLSIGGGFANDEGDERVLGGIGVPLPLWNANRRAIAEARAARDAARAAAEGEYEQLLSDLARTLAAYEAAVARLRFVESELAPLVDEQLAAARRLGRLGNYNTLVLLEAMKAAYDAKAEVLQARLKLGLAGARLRTLTETGGVGSDAARKDVQP
jgi:outer membrane protein, heavy metal efflux system